MFRAGTKEKVTHLHQTIMGKKQSLEVIRLSPPGTHPDVQNAADRYLDALNKEQPDILEKLFEKALCEYQFIYLADVMYHSTALLSLLEEKPARLIEVHKGVLGHCEELMNESNELFLQFILKESKTWQVGKRYQLFEDLLKAAIESDKKRPHSMQMVINHLYHYLCNKKSDQPIEIVFLDVTIADHLIKHAKEKRQLALPSSFWARPTIPSHDTVEKTSGLKKRGLAYSY